VTGDPWPDFDSPEPPDCEPVDELAIDAARDFCQTCGRWRPDGGCPACGGEGTGYEREYWGAVEFP
jgi:hypothetical protein